MEDNREKEISLDLDVEESEELDTLEDVEDVEDLEELEEEQKGKSIEVGNSLFKEELLHLNDFKKEQLDLNRYKYHTTIQEELRKDFIGITEAEISKILEIMDIMLLILSGNLSKDMSEKTLRGKVAERISDIEYSKKYPVEEGYAYISESLERSEGGFLSKSLLKIVRAQLSNINTMKTVKEKRSELIIKEVLGIAVRRHQVSIEELMLDYNFLKSISNQSTERIPADYHEIIEISRKSTLVNSILNKTEESVLSSYNKTYMEAFGLRPIIGVISGLNTDPLFRLGDDNKIKEADADVGYFKQYNNKIKEHMMEPECVKTCLDRQYNYRDIVDSEEVLYYPKKALEFATGRVLTQQQGGDVYAPLANVLHWGSYYKKYVVGDVRKTIDWFYTEILEDYISENTDGESVLEYITYEMFNGEKLYFSESDSKLRGKKLKDTVLDNTEFHAKLAYELDKLKKTMCSAYLLTRYVSLNNEATEVRLRAVSVSEEIGPDLGKELFRLLPGDKTPIKEGLNISEKETKVPYPIWDYSHAYDQDKAGVTPLFGYTAVEMYQKRGQKLSWDSILLGEDRQGNPIFSAKGSAIDFEGPVVHNIIAGSRSGKGVMTMNILATAVGAKKPIFYIDRKPDMACLFYELSKGNMFCINGAQYDGKNDQRGDYAEGKYIHGEGVKEEAGPAIKGWSRYIESGPDYLNKLLGSRYYEGVVGDLIYARGIMFVLSLLYARVKLASNTEVYDKLGGQTGFVAVVDEFKNFQEVFDSQKLCGSTTLGIHAVGGSVFTKYKTSKEDLKLMKETSDNKPNTLQKIARLQRQVDTAISEKGLYVNALFAKQKSVLDSCAVLNSAGLKGAESKFTDIFVIGQNIEVDAASRTLPNGSYEINMTTGQYSDSKTKAIQKTLKTQRAHSVFRTMFEQLYPDWIFGYNQDVGKVREYIGTGDAEGETTRWVTEQRYWLYTQGSMEHFRTKVPKDAVYFKPYLVLNKHREHEDYLQDTLEDGDESKKDIDFTYVTNCAKQLQSRSGIDLWKSVRVEHLMPEYKETYSEETPHYDKLTDGIGFKGLAERVMSANGINSTVEEVLGKSKEIGDYIAKAMGYEDYFDLLVDFRPEGLFDGEDVVYALENGPEAYRSEHYTKIRLPEFYEYDVYPKNNDKNRESAEDDVINQTDKGINTNYQASSYYDDEDEEDEVFVDEYSDYLNRVEEQEQGQTVQGQTVQKVQEQQTIEKIELTDAHVDAYIEKIYNNLLSIDTDYKQIIEMIKGNKGLETHFRTLVRKSLRDSNKDVYK